MTNYFKILNKSQGLQKIKFSSANQQYVLLFALLFSIFPYFYLSFFAHPIADDYNYAFLGNTRNIWEECLNQYLTWNGRYSSNILVLLNPVRCNDLLWYKASASIQLILTFICLFYFLRAITSRSFSIIATINASILFLLIYLHQMPTLAEGIYWYTGAVTYQTGICVALVYLGLLCDYFHKKYILHKFVSLFAAGVLLIIAAGFNEVLTLILICIHLGFMAIFYKNGKRIPSELILLSLLGVACILAMILAPGNAVRESYFSDNHNFVRSVSFTGMQMIRFAFSWISSLPLLLASILFVGLIISHKEKMPFFRQNYFFPVWASLSLLFLILFLCIFPAYWGTNILGQHRTVNVACFMFFLYWLVCIGTYSNIYLEKIKEFFRINKKVQPLLVVIILCTITATHNGYAVITDILYGRVNTFDREMQERYSILSNPINKNKTVYLKALSEKPASVFVLDLSSDSLSWINTSQANYFGVRTIVCTK